MKRSKERHAPIWAAILIIFCCLILITVFPCTGRADWASQIFVSRVLHVTTAQNQVTSHDHPVLRASTAHSDAHRYPVDPPHRHPVEPQHKHPPSHSKVHTTTNRIHEEKGTFIEPPLSQWSFNFSYARPADQPLNCSAGSFRFGRWIPGSHHCGLANRYTNDLYGIGSDLVSKNKITEPYPFADWCWIPNHCTADLFSVEEFCRKLNGRWMLVVGDSLSHEFYSALFMQLRARPSTYQGQVRPPKYENPEDSAICTETAYPSKLVFIRNDQLSISPYKVDRVDFPGEIFTRDWSSIAHKFGVLVLNKGAHYTAPDVTADSSKVLAAYLKRYMEYDTDADRKDVETNGRIGGHSSNRQVIYRNTPQGAPHTSVYAHPDVSVLDTHPKYMTCDGMADGDRRKYCDDWNWDKFPESDRITIGILEKELQPVAQKGRAGFSVLHAAEMSTLRPDGHRCWYREVVSVVEVKNETSGKSHDEKVVKNEHFCDELHHYLPSMVDTMVYILYNLLT